jgi:exosortase
MSNAFNPADGSPSNPAAAGGRAASAGAAPAPLLVFGACAGALLWAYWAPLLRMAQHWLSDPQYSHGWLVPLFAVALLYIRGALIRNAALRSSWWGLVILAAGVILRLAGAVVGINWIEDMSLLPALAGVVLLWGGWTALRWSWPAIAFLAFMVPLPYSIETMLARQLRQIATDTSVYVIQTIGMPALSEGTEILLNDHRLNVAPECSGLGMLLSFFALSTGIVLLVKRPLLDKLIILVSALPIAVIANIIRITSTAILFEYSFTQIAHKVIHDWAGYVMSVIALLLLWLEIKILDILFVVEPVAPMAANLGAKSQSQAFTADAGRAKQAQRR